MKLSDHLTREQIENLMKPSNFRGCIAVATTWMMILGSFALLFYFPNVFTFLISLIILGGRHLALAILMHDCSHYSLFRTRRLNDWVGQWMCAYPTWQDLKRYRVHHLRHHKYAGTEDDPDIDLVRGFPTTKSSLIRKFARDLLGITGLKRVYGLLLMDLGFIEYTVSSDVKKTLPGRYNWMGRTKLFFQTTGGMIITNFALFLFVQTIFASWVFWVWPLSYLTTFSLFLRIRSIAEHACTTMDIDPLKSTRTTLASPIARVTVAPHRVNYHLEHHILMNVPYFRLKKLHRLLIACPEYTKAYIAVSYLDVLKIATNNTQSS
ncbi:MAG: fatty acid desaturase family protein, partial [Bdellovibrionales bacterium]|nr:fatty acid desaturase family protein [Bdellovibrionales bacterium]